MSIEIILILLSNCIAGVGTDGGGMEGEDDVSFGNASSDEFFGDTGFDAIVFDRDLSPHNLGMKQATMHPSIIFPAVIHEDKLIPIGVDDQGCYNVSVAVGLLGVGN